MDRLVADPEEMFSGAEVRQLTARVTASRTRPGTAELLTNVFSVVVSVAVVVALVIGVADALRDLLTLKAGDPETASTALPLAVVRLLLLIAAVAAGGGLAARLGPAGLSGAGLRWWAPMPVDRRGLLLPSLWRSLGVGAGIGLAVGALLVLVTGVPVTVGSVLLASLAGASTGVLVVSATGLLQPRRAASGRLAAVCDGVLGAVPLLGVVLVAADRVRGAGPDDVFVGVTSWDALWWQGGHWAWGAVGAIAVVAVVLVLRWSRTLDGLGVVALSAQAATADHAGAAALSLDARELGRAMSRPAHVRLGRRSRRLNGVHGPVGALLTGEWLAFWRDRGAWLRVVSWGCLAVVAQQVAGLAHGLGLVIVLFVVGLRGGQLGSAGARSAEMAPLLDAMLPLSAQRTRLLRTVLPSVTATVSLAFALGPSAFTASSAVADSTTLTMLSWAALCLCAGVSFGAAAVRGAYRRPPSWSAPLLATPMGALPTGVAASMLKGPDLALFGAVPLFVAVVLGAPVWPVLVAQAVVAVVALAVSSWTPRAS